MTLLSLTHFLVVRMSRRFKNRTSHTVAPDRGLAAVCPSGAFGTRLALDLRASQH